MDIFSLGIKSGRPFGYTLMEMLTTLAIDHTQWLGRDRDAIAREKSGIFRPGRPVVCGDPAPPDTVYAAARALTSRHCAGTSATSRHPGR